MHINDKLANEGADAVQYRQEVGGMLSSQKEGVEHSPEEQTGTAGDITVSTQS